MGYTLQSPLFTWHCTHYIIQTKLYPLDSLQTTPSTLQVRHYILHTFLSPLHCHIRHFKWHQYTLFQSDSEAVWRRYRQWGGVTAVQGDTAICDGSWRRLWSMTYGDTFCCLVWSRTWSLPEVKDGADQDTDTTGSTWTGLLGVDSQNT